MTAYSDDLRASVGASVRSRRPRREPQSTLLPEWAINEMRKYFSPMRAMYVARTLTMEELSVLRDMRDALVIARIKRMSPGRLKRYNRFVPFDIQGQRMYERAQLDWIQDEQYLLGMRLGHSPSHQELLADFMRNQNGLRFRAYYTIKFPMRMRRMEARAG